MSANAFYEKVIKVKADVAAFLINFAFHLHTPPVVTWGRSATQFSWASSLSGFGFQFVWARLPQCFRTVCLDPSRSFPEVN